MFSFFRVFVIVFIVRAQEAVPGGSAALCISWFTKPDYCPLGRTTVGLTSLRGDASARGTLTMFQPGGAAVGGANSAASH